MLGIGQLTMGLIEAMHRETNAARASIVPALAPQESPCLCGKCAGTKVTATIEMHAVPLPNGQYNIEKIPRRVMRSPGDT